MNFLLSFYKSITSIDFYRLVIRSKVVDGVKYLLFLSAISTLIYFLSFITLGLPKVQEFIDWAKLEMPIMTLTEEGISLDVDSPYSMIHPDLGALVTFDTSLDVVALDAVQEQFVFVTKSKVYTRQNRGDIRVYNLLDALDKKNARGRSPEPIFVTPETVQATYDKVKPWILGILIFAIFGFFFLWKLIAAIFYTWLGLIANMRRKNPLTFSQIFTIAFFAMTASIVLQWLEIVIPAISNLPYSGLLSVIITSVYMFLAVRRTEDMSQDADSLN